MSVPGHLHCTHSLVCSPSQAIDCKEKMNCRQKYLQHNVTCFEIAEKNHWLMAVNGDQQHRDINYLSNNILKFQICFHVMLSYKIDDFFLNKISLRQAAVLLGYCCNTASMLDCNCH